MTVQILKNLFTIFALFFTMSLQAYAAALLGMNNQSTVTNSGVTSLYFPTIGQVAGRCVVQQKASPDPTRGIQISFDPLLAGSAAAEMIFRITNTNTLLSIVAPAGVVNNGDISIRAELVSPGAAGTPLPLVNRGTGYNNGSVNEINFGATDPNTIEFGISTRDLSVGGGDAFTTNGFCTMMGAAIGATAINFCQPQAGTNPTPVTIKFGLVVKGGTLSNANADTTTATVVLADCPPGATAAGNFTLPTYQFGLIPGDQRVKVANNTTPLSDSIVPVTALLVAADKQSPATMNANVKPIFGTASGVLSVEGLTNDQQYCFGLGYVNAAGFVQTDANWTSNFTGTQCATPSQIDGFLNRSTCFIASAAYGDEWDGRLEILRQFRDQILIQFGAGQAFVDWYYSWSPWAAHWLLSNPGYKGMVRIALLPLVEGAKISLWIHNNMWVLGVLFLVGTCGVLFSRRWQGET